MALERNRILIVDDEKGMRITLKDLLAEEGYQVDAVENGKTALATIKSEEYDVILLDVILPDIDGLEMVGEIRRRSPNSQIVIITGYGTIDDGVRALKMGAQEYICKPFKKGEIQGAVKRVLGEAKLKEKIGIRRRSEDGMDIFKGMLDFGSPGMCITTRDPKELKKAHGLEIPVARLVDLEKMGAKIEKFTRENQKAVVLIYGFEVLVKKHPPQKLEKFISNINGALFSNEAHLILAYDEASMDLGAFEELIRNVSKPHVYAAFDVLASVKRRDILLYLDAYGESSFTGLKNVMKIKNAPALSFHLRTLKNVGMVRGDRGKRYFLTQMGRDVCELLKRFEAMGARKLENIIWAGA